MLKTNNLLCIYQEGFINMGEEIKNSFFCDDDYAKFHDHLQTELKNLTIAFEQSQFGCDEAMCGIEQEAWIVDEHNLPVPKNEYLLNNCDCEFLSPELAKFNIELNVTPQAISGHGLRDMHTQLDQLWKQCNDVLSNESLRLYMTGILPTVHDDQLVTENISPLNRYFALNEQVLKSRKGKPLCLDIVGTEHLRSIHEDVMLESAATSFQIHRQIPVNKSARYYNSAIILSAPLVAASANSPYLFGKQLWDETRIPIFEQAVEVGGYGDAAHGPIRRVTFGSGYVRENVLECFQENFDHYPVLLPTSLDDKSSFFPHLRMHNGTIWRWNRPLLGFGENGELHFRIEHRVVPAGPTSLDEMANAFFFYGLHEYLSCQKVAPEHSMSFSEAKNNFYSAAQHGLNAKISWFEKGKVPISHLILNTLIPFAIEGLNMLDVNQEDIKEYIGIIRDRVETKTNGAQWQKACVKKYGHDMETLAGKYIEGQESSLPVHQWVL